MKKYFLIIIISHCFIHGYSQTDNDLLYKQICKEWIFKYNVINNTINALFKGQEKDQIKFYSPDKVIYESQGEALMGNWIFNSKDSSILIIENGVEQVNAKLIELTDSSLILEMINPSGDRVDMYLIPHTDANVSLLEDSIHFYVKKHIDLENYKINIAFPYEPRLIEDQSDSLFSKLQYDYAYPDYSYENFLYGMTIYSLKTNDSVNSGIFNQLISNYKNNSYLFNEGELVNEKDTMIQKRNARILKFKVYNKPSGIEMLNTEIFLYYKNTIIHLYVFSPVIVLNASDYLKSNKSLDYFISSFNIQ